MPVILNQMVKSEPVVLNQVFGAIANPTRRAIVARLAEGEMSVSELARPFPLSLPAVVKHLHVLERAQLLEHWKDGRLRRCRLDPEPLGVADSWLATYRVFWGQRLSALATHLEENE